LGTAVISGVTGQDGSYLAEQLLDAGWRVIGLHRRLSADNHWRIRALRGRLELRCVDLLDLSSLVDVLQETQPGHVYNLASQSHVPTSWKQPILTGEITGLGAVRMLEAVRRACPGARVYQASSSEMFGGTESFPQDERTPFAPRSPYAAAKVYAHQMAVNYRDAYGMFVSCGILFNHESERRGLEFVTRKVSDAVARIHLGLQHELALGDMKVRRDWGYAPDYTRAMVAMLSQPEPGDFVVATGRDHAVEDFVERAFAVVGRDWQNHVRQDSTLLRNNEIPCLRGNPSRARSVLGWEPEMDFDGLVERMVRMDLERVGCEH